MAQKNNQHKKRPAGLPRPTIWWVYGVIGAAIFGWYLFGESSDTPLPSEWTAVERMVGQGEVEKSGSSTATRPRSSWRKQPPTVTGPIRPSCTVGCPWRGRI